MLSKRELLYYTLKGLHLLKKTDKASVVSDLLGLQAQFANNPKTALRIRARDFREDNWDEGLVKIWSFRSTLHVVDQRETALYLSARGNTGDWGDSWYGLKKELKPYWSAFLVDCIRDGIREREALKAACRKHGMDEEVLGQVFHGWGGLLKEMCERGMTAYETGTAKRFVALEPMPFLDRDEARITVIRRYFAAFGPATVQDCAFFLGYRVRDVLNLLEKAGLPLQTVICEGVTYYHLGELTGDVKIPACLFLAGFDQLFMGYRDRSRMMDEGDRRKVITNTGIVFPTILIGGKLKAKWKKDGANITVTPFQTLTEKQKEDVRKSAARLFADSPAGVVFS